MTRAKTLCQIQLTKKNRSRKNDEIDKKTLYKLMNNTVYGKTMKNLRNRIDVKLLNKEKDYLKRASKPSYMPQKIFNSDLVAVRKNKVTLTLSKVAYARMCILDFSKVLMTEFHYDYIKNKYGNNSRLLFTATDSLMCKIKTEDLYEDFCKYKEMLNKLLVGKMKDETGGVAIK